MSERITFKHAGECGAQIDTSLFRAGKHLRCPACGDLVKVPRASMGQVADLTPQMKDRIRVHEDRPVPCRPCPRCKDGLVTASDRRSANSVGIIIVIITIVFFGGGVSCIACAAASVGAIHDGLGAGMVTFIGFWVLCGVLFHNAAFPKRREWTCNRCDFIRIR